MNYQPTNSFSSPVHRTLPAWTRSWKFCVYRESCFTRISPQWLTALTQPWKVCTKTLASFSAHDNNILHLLTSNTFTHVLKSFFPYWLGKAMPYSSAMKRCPHTYLLRPEISAKHPNCQPRMESAQLCTQSKMERSQTANSRARAKRKSTVQ